MSKIIVWFSRRNKAIAALISGVLGWCTVIANQSGGFGAVTAVEWVGLAVLIAGSLGVYSATNTPTYK